MANTFDLMRGSSKQSNLWLFGFGTVVNKQAEEKIDQFDDPFISTNKIIEKFDIRENVAKQANERPGRSGR